MTVSVMITTKDRIVDLRRTWNVLQELDPPPLEVLITADGCTEDVVNAIKEEFSKARVFVNEIGLGSVLSRDRMMRAARGDLMLALDDDSYPEQSDCISRIIAFVEEHPSLAVLHVPQRTDEYPETLAQTDFGLQRFTRTFSNSGAVLRRSTYLQLPGFESRFFHAYEEPDYALQCVAAGYDVIFSPVITIRHHYSGHERDERRTHLRHARNEFWSALIRCPFPFVLAVLAWRIFSQFRYACKRGWTWMLREPVWWCQAVRGIPYCLRRRKPVSWAGYKRWLRLP
jgi:GT2 family glycosyltransferase